MLSRKLPDSANLPTSPHQDYNGEATGVLPQMAERNDKTHGLPKNVEIALHNVATEVGAKSTQDGIAGSLQLARAKAEAQQCVERLSVVRKRSVSTERANFESLLQKLPKASDLPRSLKHRNGRIDLGLTMTHPDAVKFVCPYCNFTFAYRHVLDRHVSQIHEKHLLQTYYCPTCPYSTVRKDQMWSHVVVVHEDFKPFQCGTCDFRAFKAAKMKGHIKERHGGGDFVEIRRDDLKHGMNWQALSVPNQDIHQTNSKPCRKKRRPDGEPMLNSILRVRAVEVAEEDLVIETTVSSCKAVTANFQMCPRANSPLDDIVQKDPIETNESPDNLNVSPEANYELSAKRLPRILKRGRREYTTPRPAESQLNSSNVLSGLKASSFTKLLGQQVLQKKMSQSTSFDDDEIFIKEEPIDIEDDLIDLIPGFQCPECPFSCDSQLEMGDHYVSTHEGLHHQCIECQTAFKDVSALLSHLRAHHPRSVFACNSCGMQFMDDGQLNRHRCKVHQDVADSLFNLRSGTARQIQIEKYCMKELGAKQVMKASSIVY